MASGHRSKRVRLYGRPGNDLTDPVSLIVEALARLRSRPALSTARRWHVTSAASRRSIVSVTARMTPAVPVDLLELIGDDLRRDPLVVREATLASVLTMAAVGIRFNEHLEFDDGEAVFHHACRMGLEGIVSKRKDSTYRSGRSPDWLKMKNSACEAVRREAEEDWGR